MLKILIAAGVLLGLYAGRAYGDELPADASNDLACAVVGFELAGDAQATQEVRQAGNLIAIYYLGRLHGRAPGVDLETPIFQYSHTLTLERLNAERARCGGEFQTVGRDLRDIGQRLDAREGGGTK